MKTTSRLTLAIMMMSMSLVTIKQSIAQTAGTTGSWDLRGNSAIDPAINFIGTTSNHPIKFRTNNAQKMQLTANGKLGIGSNFSPVFKLDVKGGSINTDSLYRIKGVPMVVAWGYGSTFIGLTANTTNTGDQNTFVGNAAGYSNSTGGYNTFIGYNSGLGNTTGTDNTYLGDYSGSGNHTGSCNTMVGKASGWFNTATGNTFIGYACGYSNDNGNFNSFMGYRCGQSNITGIANTLMGNCAGYSNSAGNSNVAVGDSALYSDTGSANVAVGADAGLQNTSGAFNVFIGAKSGTSNSTGIYNTFTGASAGNKNKSGSQNSFYGNEAGYSDSSGSANSFFGHDAGFASKTTNDNTYMGAYSGYISTGNSNSFFGKGSGTYNTTGSSNTFIGYVAGGPGAATLTNACAIGANSTVTASNCMVLGSGVKVGIGISAPEYKLHIVGGTDAAVGTGGYVQLGNTIDDNLVFDNNEIIARTNGLRSPLYLNNDGGNVVINGNNSIGSVCIGTSTPATGYMLSVNGKVICTEMRVELQGNWPDYVFGKDYQLMPISELENSIIRYQHLPGLPSATEMAQQGGIDVGVMQSKLLEKIEELSLYIIQLEKKITKIETANR